MEQAEIFSARLGIKSCFDLSLKMDLVEAVLLAELDKSGEEKDLCSLFLEAGILVVFG